MGVDASKINLYSLKGQEGVSSTKANIYVLFLPAHPLAFSSKVNAYINSNLTGENNQACSKSNIYILCGPPISNDPTYIAEYFSAFTVPIPIPDMSKFSF